MNRLVQRAVTLANGRIMLVDHKRGSRWVQPVCDEARLYQFLRAELARSWWGSRMARKSTAIKKAGQ